LLLQSLVTVQRAVPVASNSWNCRPLLSTSVIQTVVEPNLVSYVTD